MTTRMKRDRESGHRMRLLRHWAVGNHQGSQSEFSNRVGLTAKQWNHFERGFPVPRDVAIALVLAFSGLTTDWILMGRDGGLTVRLKHELNEAEKTLPAPRPPRQRVSSS